MNYNRPEPSVFLGSILILLVNPVLKPSTITSSSLVSATRKPSSVSVGGFQFKASTSSVASASNSSVQQEPACTNTKVGGGGSVRKFSSFDSPPREKKIIAKFRSDSHIAAPTEKQGKVMFSKEDIERKKREAIERRKANAQTTQRLISQKEEIERKKREALERRKVSMSQKRN